MKIGDFDSAWSAYDRTAGPVLINESKERFKVEDGRPNWRLTIDNQNWTSQIEQLEVNFSDDGTSGLTATLARSAYGGRYERTKVNLWIGYGTKIVPYFQGRLTSAKDHKSGLYTEIEVEGLGTKMGAIYNAARHSYHGWPLSNAWWNLMGRTGEDFDRFDWLVTEEEIIESDMGGFGLEHSFLEQEQTILEPYQIQAYDDIGGMRIARKAPTFASLSEASLVGIFTEDDYPKDGFEFFESSRNHYGSVCVLRRAETFQGGGKPGQGPGMVQSPSGRFVPNAIYGSDAMLTLGTEDGVNPEDEYAVFWREPVTYTGRYRIWPRRSLMVADFPGDQAGCERAAKRLAETHSIGSGKFNFSCSPVDISLHDRFGVKQTEETRDQNLLAQFDYVSLGKQEEVLYACAPQQINLQIAKRVFDMQISGTAAEKSRVQTRAAGSRIQVDLHIPGTDPAPPAPDNTSGGSTPNRHAVIQGGNRVVANGNAVFSNGRAL